MLSALFALVDGIADVFNRLDGRLAIGVRIIDSFSVKLDNKLRLRFLFSIGATLCSVSEAETFS